jgi:protein O-mannosyl-transferase
MASKTRRQRRASAEPPLSSGLPWFLTLPWLFTMTLVVTLLAYGPVLHGSFIFDDFHLPFADPHAAEMPARFWIGGVRPVLMLTYWANFLASGTDTVSYHVLNVILHVITGLLVFGILECLLSVSGTLEARRARFFALTGAAIFVFHPLQTESVAYIAGRSEVVSGLLFFAAWLVFLCAFADETTIVTSLKILLLSGAAVLAKESAISLPAVMLLTDVFWADRPLSAQLRRRRWLYIPFLIGGIGAAVSILQRVVGASGTGSSSGISRGQYLLTECRAILIYLRLFFFPFGQNGDWRLPIFKSLTDNGAWFYAAAFIVLLAAIALLIPRARLAAFGLLIFLITLAPTSSLVPVADALAERRMYIPIAGLILAVIGILVRVQLTANVLRIIAVASVLAAVAFTWHRTPVWAGPRPFWNDAVQGNPANPRAHFGLGTALLAQKDCKRAVEELTKGRAAEPKNDDIVWNLAQAYRCTNQQALALTTFREFVDIRPTANAWDEIAYTEAQLGMPDDLFTAVSNALRIDPNNALAYAYRGLARIAANDTGGAYADFQHSLQLEPQNPVALTGLRRLAENRRK